MSAPIELGLTNAGKPGVMDIEELLATRLLVQGNSGSGKSHLLRRLLEQSARLVQQVIIDPEGDFVSLADEYDHVVVDAAASSGDLETIAERIRKSRASCVLNLEAFDAEQQMKAAATFLNGLFDAEREFWYPCLVVVDEAQLFAPAAAGEVSDEARKLSLGAMTNLMCRGRKRGLAGIIATQRLAKLAKNVAAEASNFLMGRTFLDIDMARAADLLGLDKRQAEMFRELPRGSFVALGPALYRKPEAVNVGAVITKPRGSTPKLTPPPTNLSEADREELLAPAPMPAMRVPVPRTPVTPPPSTNEVLARIVAARPMGEEPASSMSEEERESALKGVIDEIVSDPETPTTPTKDLYNAFAVRCRIRRVPGPTLTQQDFHRRLTVARAAVGRPELADDPNWLNAIEVSRAFPEDVQLLFLLFARAAVRRAPCPSDLTLAAGCGIASVGRLRGRLANMEKYGYTATRNDMRGMRIVGLPHLGMETGAGDASGPNVLPVGQPQAAAEPAPPESGADESAGLEAAEA